jgi:hypothetical protein
MASYAIFNYQFYKIIKKYEEGRLFPADDLEMAAEQSFPQRQIILNTILKEDFNNEKHLYFRSKYSGDKEYIHLHLIPPTEDIVIIRIANKRTTTIVTEELKEKQEDDYPNCIVIIDNRPGIQRILIENKKTAFQDVKQLANILKYTFDRELRNYNLGIELMHLQDPRAFWQFANDRRSYPDGFYKITFHLPHLNLERLKKVFDKVLILSREVFDSDLEWSYKAQQGGELPLDENNEYQKALIDWMMGEVGSENIKLYSNVQKRKAIIVGRESFLAVGISDAIIRRLTEEAVNGDLFGSSALDEIKIKTKTGIDPNNIK